MADPDADQEPAGETDADVDAETSDGDTAEPRPVERSTAPQSNYTMRAVGVGALVALGGILIVVGIPLLATM